MIDPGTVTALTIVGAVVGLDFVSFPQAMLSRPLVAASLGGAICGDLGIGLLLGVLLECFALETMPFGASRYPEWGPASVAAGALAAIPGDRELAARMLPFAVLAGLGAAMIGGLTLVWLRRINLSVAGRYREELAAGDASAVIAVHRMGMVVDFGRAGAVTALFVLTLLPIREVLQDRLDTVDGVTSAAVVGVIAVGVAGSAVWKVVHTAKGFAWYVLAGLAAGLLMTLTT
ncbi:MAG: PTS sugar transporter subunit IIC [Gemmatimonadetes bacterium]|nr:PTS sugar transporter subunit IIC [Gemmatimonadota bacterium]